MSDTQDQQIVVYVPGGIAPNGIDRTDEAIVRMWLAGKSVHTRRAYQGDANRLFLFTGKTLAATRLEDLQDFSAGLEKQGLAAGSRKRILAAIKSLFSFASEGGIQHIRYNAAAALHLPKSKDTLNQRILSEEQVGKIIDSAKGGRDRVMIELLYLAGIRAEELTRLCWRDAIGYAGPGTGGILTVFGKGDKTRHLRVEGDAWDLLVSWRGEALSDEPIFRSRLGGKMSTVQVWRIVSQAAKRAGCKASTHWLRHAHATHAIDHGCDLRTLQQSMGHASGQTTERYVHSRPKQSSGAFVKRIPNKGATT